MMEQGKALPPTVEAFFDAALEREQQRKNVDEISRQIHDRIVFKLMGYDLDGMTYNSYFDRDAAEILKVEETLIVDPQVLKTEFEMIREKRKEIGNDDDAMDQFIARNTVFGRSGGHAYPNDPWLLKRVRREGWAVMAGINDAQGKFHTVAYNYGLDTMAEDDEMFRDQSISTLQLPQKLKEEQRSRIAFNWRSGTAESIDASLLRDIGINVPEDQSEVSLRRIGIASAIKYLIASLAKARGKEEIWFNIGTIYDVHSAERIRNVPSYQHNKQIFEDDEGYRRFPTEIGIKDPSGDYEKVGLVHWRARTYHIDKALRKLVEDKNVLAKRAWDIKQSHLDETVQTMRQQIEKEQEEGTHK